jgi:isoamylase
LHEVDQLSSFFTIIHQDPIISQVKLIAEPWDVGEGGYQVGNFPVLWAEWNGKYRDAVRRFWNGYQEGVADLAYRLSGSSDLYEMSGRRPYASINFVTAHDGFTLNDLVSYKHKHNEANGENNMDGESHNMSVNFGVEGETDKPEILERRERQKRNFLITLLLSQGVPMILGGDEFGRTQKGNNNAYCQDNEISWFDWNLDERQQALLDFTRRLVALRHKHPVLRRPKFFQGRQIHGSDVKDIQWLRSDGQEMTETDWAARHVEHLGMLLSGDMMDVLDEYGEPIQDDTLLVLFNGGREPVRFRMPRATPDATWEVVLNTADAKPPSRRRLVHGRKPLVLDSLSVVVLRRREE